MTYLAICEDYDTSVKELLVMMSDSEHPGDHSRRTGKGNCRSKSLEERRRRETHPDEAPDEEQLLQELLEDPCAQQVNQEQVDHGIRSRKANYGRTRKDKLC